MNYEIFMLKIDILFYMSLICIILMVLTDILEKIDNKIDVKRLDGIKNKLIEKNKKLIKDIKFNPFKEDVVEEDLDLHNIFLFNKKDKGEDKDE